MSDWPVPPNGFLEQNASGRVAEEKSVLGRKSEGFSKKMGERTESIVHPVTTVKTNILSVTNNQKVINLFGDTIVKFQIWTNQLGLCQFSRYVFNFSDNFLKDMCIIWIFF